MTPGHQATLIGVVGIAASCAVGAMFNSGVAIGLGFMVTGALLIVASSHGYIAGKRAMEYKRKAAEFRAGPTRHFGLAHPMSQHDTAPDMTVDDFNRATRVGGQPLIQREVDRRDMLRDGRSLSIVRNDRDLT